MTTNMHLSLQSVVFNFMSFLSQGLQILVDGNDLTFAIKLEQNLHLYN